MPCKPTPRPSLTADITPSPQHASSPSLTAHSAAERPLQVFCRLRPARTTTEPALRTASTTLSAVPTGPAVTHEDSGFCLHVQSSEEVVSSTPRRASSLPGRQSSVPGYTPSGSPRAPPQQSSQSSNNTLSRLSGTLGQSVNSTLHNSITNNVFTFTHVFPEASTQIDVYRRVGLPVVEDVLKGYNGSVLVYGQTGSGKTYTMFGPPHRSLLRQETPHTDSLAHTQRSVDICVSVSTASSEFPPSLDESQEHRLQDPHSSLLRDTHAYTWTPEVPFSDIHSSRLNPSHAIATQAMDTIFKTIERAPKEMRYQVEVSLLEVYMERVRDLLAGGCGRPTAADSLKLREDVGNGSFYVEGCLTVAVTSIEESMKLVGGGLKRRMVGQTAMNDTSSRSHCLLSVVVRSTNCASGEERVGRLALVDLAGSEKVSKTKSMGQQLEEAKQINKSLTTLSLVIQALSTNSAHIPYRNSVLTKLLKESLGGNARTSMVVCCSPEIDNAAETLSTLRFGALATKVVNRMVVNEWKARHEGANGSLGKLSDAQKEIQRLEGLLQEECMWRLAAETEALEQSSSLHTGRRSSVDVGTVTEDNMSCISASPRCSYPFERETKSGSVFGVEGAEERRSGSAGLAKGMDVITPEHLRRAWAVKALAEDSPVNLFVADAEGGEPDKVEEEVGMLLRFYKRGKSPSVSSALQGTEKDEEEMKEMELRPQRPSLGTNSHPPHSAETCATAATVAEAAQGADSAAALRSAVTAMESSLDRLRLHYDQRLQKDKETFELTSVIHQLQCELLATQSILQTHSTVLSALQQQQQQHEQPQQCTPTRQAEASETINFYPSEEWEAEEDQVVCRRVIRLMSSACSSLFSSLRDPADEMLEAHESKASAETFQPAAGRTPNAPQGLGGVAASEAWAASLCTLPFDSMRTTAVMAMPHSHASSLAHSTDSVVAEGDPCRSPSATVPLPRRVEVPCTLAPHLVWENDNSILQQSAEDGRDPSSSLSDVATESSPKPSSNDKGVQVGGADGKTSIHSESLPAPIPSHKEPADMAAQPLDSTGQQTLAERDALVRRLSQQCAAVLVEKSALQMELERAKGQLSAHQKHVVILRLLLHESRSDRIPVGETLVRSPPSTDETFMSGVNPLRDNSIQG